MLQSENIHLENNFNIILNNSEFVSLTSQLYSLILLPIQYKMVLFLSNNRFNLNSNNACEY